jgi:uncharacterized protein YggE
MIRESLLAGYRRTGGRHHDARRIAGPHQAQPVLHVWKIFPDSTEDREMKNALILSLGIVTAGAGICRGQVSGNVAYAQGGGKAQAQQAERAKRVLTKYELPPSPTATFLEASVLINVKADEYVATFGLAHEGADVAECNRKMDATVARFTEDLRGLGVVANNIFVDFVAQNRVYGFEVEAEIAREKLTGFELKKTISIRYTDGSLLDRLVVVAARSEIYDLIKVDYVVRDVAAVEDRLMEAAAQILKRKASRYEELLGIRLRPPAQVYAERYSVYYPSELYDSYTAAESEDITVAAVRQRYTVQGARKARTFFFNGLDGDGFDEVINPIMLEPMVQFTLYLKLKYEAEAVAAD